MSFMGWTGEPGDPTRPGVPAVPWLASANESLALGAAVPVALQFNTPNDGKKHHYMVGGTVTITALGTGSINLEVTYTDDGGAARTCIIPLCAEAGAFAALANTADAWKGFVVIAANPNTQITLLTAGVFTGGIAYNLWPFAMQLD